MVMRENRERGYDGDFREDPHGELKDLDDFEIPGHPGVFMSDLGKWVDDLEKGINVSPLAKPLTWKHALIAWVIALTFAGSFVVSDVRHELDNLRHPLEDSWHSRVGGDYLFEINNDGTFVFTGIVEIWGEGVHHDVVIRGNWSTTGDPPRGFWALWEDDRTIDGIMSIEWEQDNLSFSNSYHFEVREDVLILGEVDMGESSTNAPFPETSRKLGIGWQTSCIPVTRNIDTTIGIDISRDLPSFCTFTPI